MLAQEFIYGLQDNNEQEPILTGTDLRIKAIFLNHVLTSGNLINFYATMTSIFLATFEPSVQPLKALQWEKKQNGEYIVVIIF